MTVLARAVAMFWFPVMIALGPAAHRPSHAADLPPVLLGAGLPIGMFAVATAQTRAATQVDLLGWLDGPILVLAPLAWAVTIVGLVRQLVRSLRRR